MENMKIIPSRDWIVCVGLLLLLTGFDGEGQESDGGGSGLRIGHVGEGTLEILGGAAAGDQHFRVEWSSDLSNWFQSWDAYADLRALREAPVVVDLPRFFRAVRVEASYTGLVPLSDADFGVDGERDAAKIELGRLLFFDKLLGGNRNISCATCHHSLTGTGDGLSLSIGEGGRGLGMMRALGDEGTTVRERVPRNAPPVFNLGAREIDVMFHDGRLVVDAGHPSGFRSPAGDALPEGLDSILAAQAMFPVTSAAEMAGETGENAVADAAAAGDFPLVWELLAQRLREIPAYFVAFRAAFPDAVRTPSDIVFKQAANAIAAFEAHAWRSDGSPFDRYLRGETAAMSGAARRGMELFYGKAKCATCHSGVLQTDQGFHAIAMPQVGPGKGHGDSGHEDFGRGAVTGDVADRYRFRTPSLRNVAITGPYGHAGAYDTLRSVVEHHLDPVSSLMSYDPGRLQMPYSEAFDDLVIYRTRTESGATNLWQAIAAANELAPVHLATDETDALIDFLHALTDPAVFDLRRDVPQGVPSLIPVFE